VIRSGRALLYPVYKSTFERGDVIATDYPSKTAVWRDHMIMWSKDVGRSIDYLESRSEIERDKIAYLGYSWGAGMAPLFLALEPRIKVGLLMVGGFYLRKRCRSGSRQLHVARDDADSDAERPLRFLLPDRELAGADVQHVRHSAAHKRRVVYDTSHTIPRTETIRENVEWLERYLGPVK
jgi:predicted esterase